MTTEDDLIRRIAALASPGGKVRVPIGDDAAVIDREPGPLIATADMLVEGIDFLSDEDPVFIGRRALGANLSDLAAMGAEPEMFLLSLGLPAGKTEEYALALARGAVEKGSEFGAELAGGDLSRSAETVVAVSLWGRLSGTPLSRRGASPGDSVFVSGFPGRAAAGLTLEKGGARLAPSGELSRVDAEGFAKEDREAARELLLAFLDPKPRMELAASLARTGSATAAIDISDGLGRDAGRLASASGVQIVLEERLLPVAAALSRYSAKSAKPATEWILAGGDDYELLFTALPEKETEIRSLAERCATPVARIGSCQEGRGVICQGGSGEREVSRAGFDHFER